jgi:hypothetical protein
MLRVELPHPLRLAARLALVATALLWLANHYATSIVQPFVPAIQNGLTSLAADFRILGTEIYLEDGIRTLRIRADLARPTVIAGNVLTPINPGSTIIGWMDIRLTLGGLMQYPLLLLIVVLAWPAQSMREMLARLALTLPLAALLFGLTISVTIMAELWFPIHGQYAPGEHWPLLTLSRLLMGGGGQALALTLAVIAINLPGYLPGVWQVCRHASGRFRFSASSSAAAHPE